MILSKVLKSQLGNGWNQDLRWKRGSSKLRDAANGWECSCLACPGDTGGWAAKAAPGHLTPSAWSTDNTCWPRHPVSARSLRACAFDTSFGHLIGAEWPLGKVFPQGALPVQSSWLVQGVIPVCPFPSFLLWNLHLISPYSIKCFVPLSLTCLVISVLCITCLSPSV